MKYLQAIQSASSAPEQLEILYQTALRENTAAEFRADLLACYADAPGTILYAAWFHRLEHSPDLQAEHRRVNWALALPLSLAAGLLLWLLSDLRLVYTPNNMPYLAVYAAPVIALFGLAFLSLTAKRGYRDAVAAGVCLAAAAGYVLWLAADRQHYRELMAPHLFLLSWVAVGAGVAGLGKPFRQTFAFLIKSIEVVVTGGVYLIATVIFSAVALNMFGALDINIPEGLTRLAFVGLGGVIPVLAIASVYDPLLSPDRQEFKRGVGRLIVTFPRILLGLTLAVLAVYLFAIPFNFMAPFRNRDVLIAYNAMLFAVIGLLVGATPVSAGDLPPRYSAALRAGILAVASLVALISLYALAAVIWRTLGGALTINRLTVIGWNIVNVALLSLLLVRQARLGRAAGEADWIGSLQRTFANGAGLYLGWALFVTFVTPWLF